MKRAVSNATLHERIDVSPTLAIFRFTLEGGVPEFEAGQFLTLGVPTSGDAGARPTWRAYSIASPPSCRDHVELFVRRADPPGILTTSLWHLQPGESLPHRGIAGAFTMEAMRPDGGPDTRALLLVGSGTGVAPLLSMTLELAARGWPREVTLLHGASFIGDLAYDGLLRETAERSLASPDSQRRRMTYIPVISRPEHAANAGWRGETGRVESLLRSPGAGAASRLEELLGMPLEPTRFFAHACGFDDSVSAIKASLRERGFRTHRERHPDGSFDVKSESFG